MLELLFVLYVIIHCGLTATNPSVIPKRNQLSVVEFVRQIANLRSIGIAVSPSSSTYEPLYV
jgi:hypothetical protein